MGMTTLILMVGVGALLYFFARKYGAPAQQPTETRPAERPPEATAGGDTAELYRVADQVEEFFKKSAHPSDLIDNEDFQRGVAILSSQDYTEDDLLSYYGGDNTIISCMALAALGKRSCGPEAVDKIIYYIGSCGIWPLYFAFEEIARFSEKPLIGAVLLQAPSWWIDNRLMLTLLRDFVAKCVAHNERVTFGKDLAAIGQEQIGYLSALIEKLGLEALRPLAREIRQTLSTRIDRRYLNSVGHLWTESQTPKSVHINAQRKACLQQIERTLTGGSGRSVILVGEAGVGKTTLVNALAERLGEGGMAVFEAGATELIAGQSFIGDLEERLRDLVKHLDRRRGIVWFVPNIHELRYAGRHRYSAVGILDMLMPYIDSGAITLVGETRPTPFAQLKRDTPRIKAVFEIIAVDPLDQAETLSIARQWAGHCAAEHLETRGCSRFADQGRGDHHRALFPSPMHRGGGAFRGGSTGTTVYQRQCRSRKSARFPEADLSEHFSRDLPHTPHRSG